VDKLPLSLCEIKNKNNQEKRNAPQLDIRGQECNNKYNKIRTHGSWKVRKQKWYFAGKTPQMIDEAKVAVNPKNGWLLARNFVLTRTAGQSLRKMPNTA
jgi:hypothetical protein